jgi:hypothetical protein
VLLCRVHHVAVHEAGWRLERDPGSGRVVLVPPAPRPRPTRRLTRPRDPAATRPHRSEHPAPVAHAAAVPRPATTGPGAPAPALLVPAALPPEPMVSSDHGAARRTEPL